MRYCRKCHIFYSSVLAACPKCGVNEPENSPEPAPRADKKTVRRDWIIIIIGIPVLIAAVYLMVKLIKIIF